MKTIRRLFDVLAKMGLSVRDDPPRVLDPGTRQWCRPVEGFTLSANPIANDDPEAVPGISVALRNVGEAAATLELPAWLFFYRIEIDGASLTPYGRTLLKPERNIGHQTVTLLPGALTETLIPIGAIYAIKPGAAHRLLVSCQIPGAGQALSATTTIM